MDNLSYILFICVAAPIALMILPIDKRSRKVVYFILIGMFCCLFVSELNGLLLSISNLDLLFFTTNITPITEEITKAIPVLFFAIVFSDKKENVITVSFSTGVGFAILENLIILTQNFNDVDLIFALIRGFCSGLMHSICSVAVGYFIVFVKKKRKIFLAGTVSALNLAIVYHSVYNMLVQTDKTSIKIAGFLLPFLTYAILNLLFRTKLKSKTRISRN